MDRKENAVRFAAERFAGLNRVDEAPFIAQIVRSNMSRPIFELNDSFYEKLLANYFIVLVVFVN